MARLAAAKQTWSTALDLLDEAQRVYVGDFAPPVHPIHATRARVMTAAGLRGGDIVGDRPRSSRRRLT